MRILLIILMVLSMRAQASLFSCEIFIPGDGVSSVESMYSIRWNADLELHQAAASMSRSLLQVMNLCRRPAILKAHGYGAVVAYYILALGKRFHDLFPNHPYIQVFKQTIGLYSYNGAFKGSPLMDHICANEENGENFEGVLGRKCLLSLTTSAVHHASTEVNSPGVLVYLVSSTSTGYINEKSKVILGNFGINLNETGEFRNLNDGVLPFSSSLACAEKVIIGDQAENCTKINDIFFRDLLRLEDYGHFQIYNDPEHLEMIHHEVEH